MFEDRDNDVSSLFLEDSKEKKRVGRNAVAMKGKRGGGRGAVRLPQDMLSRREKSQYTKPSPVITYKLGESVREEHREMLDLIKQGLIPSLSELRGLPPLEAQDAVVMLRKMHTNEKLIGEWKFYNKADLIDVMENEFRVRKVQGGKVLRLPIHTETAKEAVKVEEQAKYQVLAAFNADFNAAGLFTGEQAGKILDGAASMVEDWEGQIELEIRISIR